MPNVGAPEFTWPIRVYYEDTDFSGVVYHAGYLRFLERARTEWLRAQGYSQERLQADGGVAFVVAHIAIAFRRPARMDDELLASVEVAMVRHASLEFSQTLSRRADPAALLVEARVRVACVEATSFRPRALPERLLRLRPGLAGSAKAAAVPNDANQPVTAAVEASRKQ